MQTPNVETTPRNEHTIWRLLANWSAVTPDAPALLAPGQRTLSYGQLQRLVENTVSSLQSHGFDSQSRLAVVLRNSPEMATAFLALAAGAVCAPLNPASQAFDFELNLKDLRPQALIIEDGVNSPARDVARSLGIAVIELTPRPSIGAGWFTLWDEISSTIDETLLPQDTSPALLLPTSGTTSRPKLVPLSQANLCAPARHIAQTLQLCPEDRCLNVMPLFHIHGLIGAVLASLSAGASVVCTSGWDSQSFFEWLKLPGISWYTAVPTIHQSILSAAAERGSTVEHRLRFVRSSSAALPTAVFDALESLFGVPAIESYGMTEAAHQMCSNPLPPGIRKKGSVGLPAGPEVVILNENGELLGANQNGELAIRGPNVTAGYVDNPAANTASFNNGWFRTGDQGYRDDDGYFFLTGRLKEMVNRGGEKVAPREVDEVFLQHPAVEQAIAFAIPHPRLGEDLAVAIVLRTHAIADQCELQEFALDRLAPQKVPSRIVFVPAIPKGPTGKLRRIGLHEALSDSLKVEFQPPESSAELAIANVWKAILSCEEIGRFDNFFYLGGDSLLATRVLSRLSTTFEIQLPLGTLFQHPTLQELAKHIETIVLEQIESESDHDCSSGAIPAV